MGGTPITATWSTEEIERAQEQKYDAMQEQRIAHKMETKLESIWTRDKELLIFSMFVVALLDLALSKTSFENGIVTFCSSRGWL